MPDLTETSGQYMKQKTAYELFGRQHHCLFLVIAGSIQVGKGDTVFVNVFNPVIGDRDLVGITRQVFEDRIRVFEWLFGMYYPIGFIELFLQLPEVVILFQMADLSLQGQLIGFVKHDELLEKFPPKCLGNGSIIKQEVSSAFGALPIAITIQASCRNNAMDVGMIKQCLCPGVQDSNHAHSCHKPMFGIFGKIIQCLPGTTEQQVVNQPLILIADRSQFRRQCEYHMEVFNIQQIILTLQYPLFFIDSLALRTMAIATGIIMNFNVPARRAGRHMTSQHMGTALLYITDEFLLFKA